MEYCYQTPRQAEELLEFVVLFLPNTLTVVLAAFVWSHWGVMLRVYILKFIGTILFTCEAFSHIFYVLWDFFVCKRKEKSVMYQKYADF